MVAQAAALTMLGLLQGAGAAEAWERFPALPWIEPGVPREEARALAEQLGGALVLRLEEAPAGLDFLVFNAPGRDDLHLDADDPAFRDRWERWVRTRDEALLVREPCLSDPATRERLRSNLAQALAARGGRAGLGASLGDEVSLTPAGRPLDWCLCPRCSRAWRAWLERQELSEAERTALADPSLASTDAALRSLEEEGPAAIGPWLLRRRFQQEVALELLAELAAESRCLAPEVPVGLLGMAGETAFGNVAVERILPALDFAESYRTGNARELLMTLRAPAQRALLTVFVEKGRPDRAAWQVWEHALRGGDAVVVWSAEGLRADPEVAARLAEALEGVRSARARWPAFRPAPSGAALVHSADAVRVSWLLDARLDGATWPRRLQSWQEQHGTLEAARAGWLRLFEDCGVQPGALPLAQVGADSARRFPLLVLSHLLVLDEADLGRLESHLRAGGRLIVHGKLGWIDSRGRARAQPALERLRAAAPENVVEVDGPIDAYVQERGTRLASARAWRERASRWLDEAGVERPRWTARGVPEELPWLASWSKEASSGGWLVWALPNWAQDGGARLDELALEIDPGEGWQVDYLRPHRAADMRLLRAGDAAVFRLVPRR